MRPLERRATGVARAFHISRRRRSACLLGEAAAAYREPGRSGANNAHCYARRSCVSMGCLERTGGPFYSCCGKLLMAKKETRVMVVLACTVCKRRNYNTQKNKSKTTDRLELKKYCRFCRSHNPHRETR